MIGILNWKIVIGKEGMPYISWDAGAFGEMRADPESKDIKVTNDAIVFNWTVRGRAERYYFSFDSLNYEIPPIAISSTAKPHVLCFIYEVIFSVLTDKCPVILNKVPLDIEALLTKYDAFRGQLEGLDYERIASNMNLKKRGS